MDNQQVCRLCRSGTVIWDVCSTCQDFSRFIPGSGAATAGTVGLEDLKNLTTNGQMCVLLWLAQRRMGGT